MLVVLEGRSLDSLLTKHFAVPCKLWRQDIFEKTVVRSQFARILKVEGVEDAIDRNSRLGPARV
jgi:hypothetical protein